MIAILEQTTADGLAWEHPLSSPVTVLGSGTHADIQLASGEPHVATVEYRQGAYYVHNRSGRVLRMRGRKFRPGAVRRWASGQVLQADSSTRLVLWYGNDLTPAARTPQLPAPGALAPPAPAYRKRASGRKQKWLLWGAVALSAAFYLYASGPPPVSVNEFEAVIEPWLTPEGQQVPGYDNPSRVIVARLQLAREYELAGNGHEAYTTYARLRDDLQELKRAGGDPRIAPTYRFALGRLADLSGQ